MRSDKAGCAHVTAPPILRRQNINKRTNAIYPPNGSEASENYAKPSRAENERKPCGRTEL